MTHGLFRSSILVVVALLSLKMTIAWNNGPRVSFILGPPLAGKGTQASLLVGEFDAVHLSAGDLLREERESGSETAELIESYITKGAIVPVAITLELIKSAMNKSGGNRFLIDGFPRNQDNLEGWIDAMPDVIVDNVLFLDCDKDELVKRMHLRSKEFGRSDDNPDTLKKRLETFKESTLPVVNVFRDQGKVIAVNGGGRSINEVYVDVSKCIRDCIEREIVEINAKLIECADRNEWQTYRSLTDEQCTCVGAVLKGEVFEDGGLLGSSCEEDASLSEIGTPCVQVNGKVCVISYSRRKGEELFDESRVWMNNHGHWKQIHYHRSSSLSVGSSSAAEKMQDMFRLSM